MESNEVCLDTQGTPLPRRQPASEGPSPSCACWFSGFSLKSFQSSWVRVSLQNLGSLSHTGCGSCCSSVSERH